MNHVISWSGGKDSTATIILMHEHQEEILKKGDTVTILFSEVMFDLKNNISGHNPDIIAFIYRAKKVFERWGFDVEILRADKDYLDIFYHRLSRSIDPERIGLTYGFVLSRLCAVKRDLKIKPINRWLRQHPGEMTHYIGIAADEPRRLRVLENQGFVSLLAKYGMTESDAMELCRAYDLLSPQYSLEGQTRDGCWFCPNAKLCEHRVIKERYPKVWEKYVSLEKEPDLAFPKWSVFAKETLHERDVRLKQLIGGSR